MMEMIIKKLVITFIAFLVISCDSGDSQFGVISSNIQDQPSGSRILKTKVIDGYISGANIFIDLNWNLTQDINEPSAYEDTENNEYYFEIDDFSSIIDFTVECARDRPRVAEIPIGAVDSEGVLLKMNMRCISFHIMDQLVSKESIGQM